MSDPTDPMLLAALAQAEALERNADFLAWAQTLVLADAVGDARRRDRDAGVRRVLDDAVARSGLDPNTLRRRVRTIEYLRDHGLAYIAEQRVVSIGVAARIAIDKHATDDEKQQLLKEVHGALVADPCWRDVRAEVGRRLQVLRAAKSKDGDWRRDGDLWQFTSCDPRFGDEGQPFRLPGQAALNLIDRFWSGEGRVVSAMCGSGTVLDACALLGVKDYLGLDLRLDERVRDLHAAHFMEFDATATSWRRVCAAESAGMAILTPPPFCFGKSAETHAATDLGSFSDPSEWVAGMRCVVAGATNALMVGGVIAVAIRATAEFENGTPVPDLRYEISRVLAEAGYECYLGNPVITVGRPRAQRHDGAWLYPEIVQAIVMRKT